MCHIIYLVNLKKETETISIIEYEVDQWILTIYTGWTGET